MAQKIVYTRPKGYNNLIEKFQQSIQQNYDMAQQIREKKQIPSTIKSIETYHEIKKIMSDVFIQCIKTESFDQSFCKEQSKKYHMVIGPISSGKSSLINRVFKIHLPVGVGQITQQWGSIQDIGDDQGVRVFDVPGINQFFQFTDPQKLTMLVNMDYIFFCFNDSLKNSKEVLRVLNQLKPEGFCVIRTQVDKYNQGDSKTISQELQVDRKYLRQIGIKDTVPLYSVSVRKPDEYRDNLQVFSKLKGKDLFSQMMKNIDL